MRNADKLRQRVRERKLETKIDADRDTNIHIGGDEAKWFRE